ncbi:hypothetical protein F8M49_27905 [Rhodococcus zopfii]|uniref:WXG100 family type VII secretion target n=1 Tax=Rhodococcus zopfii TaxID=43772 RepID=A0ABU3WW98_9NOCA|nr:hypothetical protein [Rhodococcus zopfii]
MTPTVSAVTTWNPEALRATADSLDELVEKLDGRLRSLVDDQDALAEQWNSDAARSAATRIMRERSLGSAIAGALQQIADAYRTGAVIIEGAQMHLTTVVNNAEQQEFTVHDDGTVDALSQIALLQLLLPDHASFEIARIRLERDSAVLTVAVLEALVQADAAVLDASARISTTLTALDDAGKAVIPGKVVRSENGEFSWRPDWPATTAAATIGVVTDSTKEGLQAAAIASGDDLGRGIARGLGPAGALLGAVPAIANDIEGGMDPTKATVTETGGAAMGFGASLAAGALVGSVVPGAGTAVGIAVGAVAGGLAAWGSSKGFQWLWDRAEGGS